MATARIRLANQTKGWRVLIFLVWGSLTSMTFVQSAFGQVAPVLGAMRFVGEAVAVSEQDGSATIWVAREAGSAGPATLRYPTVADTAAAGSDYEEVDNAYSFFYPRWETWSTDIPIIDDVDAEGPERLRVLLHDPEAASLSGSTTLTLEILDDGQLPSGGALAFTTDYMRRAETDGAIVVEVALQRRSWEISWKSPTLQT